MSKQKAHYEETLTLQKTQMLGHKELETKCKKQSKVIDKLCQQQRVCAEMLDQMERECFDKESLAKNEHDYLKKVPDQVNKMMGYVLSLREKLQSATEHINNLEKAKNDLEAKYSETL